MTDTLQIKPALEQFKDAIAAKGITPPTAIQTDGQIHRFSSSGKPDDDAGWYAYHDGAVPVGSFGDFRTGQKVRLWMADIGRALTSDEQTDLKKRQEELNKSRLADTAQQRAEAKKKAAGILRISKLAPDDHPYLTRKGIAAHGVRQWKDMLVIPMVDETGEIQSVQLISSDSGKKFLKGGKMQGCFHILGDTKDADHILIAEGFATAATVHEVTGFPVVIAYNAGNLQTVARAIRAAHPDAKLTLCADDDFKTAGNPGVTSAQKAADEVGGEILIPEFDCAHRPDKATDFNDMAAQHGKDAVTRFFTSHFSEKTTKHETDDINTAFDDKEDAEDASLTSSTTPHAKLPPAARLKRQFSVDEMGDLNRIWKNVPRRITYHSESSYQIVMTGKDKIIVTRNRIELPRKEKHRSNAAYQAACEHASQFWNGRMEVHGSTQHKIKAWAFALAHGVEIVNYTPSDEEMIEAQKIMLKESQTVAKSSVYPDEPARRDGKVRTAAKLEV